MKMICWPDLRVRSSGRATSERSSLPWSATTREVKAGKLEMQSLYEEVSLNVSERRKSFTLANLAVAANLNDMEVAELWLQLSAFR